VSRYGKIVFGKESLVLPYIQHHRYISKKRRVQGHFYYIDICYAGDSICTGIDSIGQERAISKEDFIEEFEHHDRHCPECKTGGDLPGVKYPQQIPGSIFYELV
jgi:hypothetical protein